MRIVCPKCELKGQVDAVPTGAKTRIACVRCATTFDAVFVDGEIQAHVSQATPPAAMIESTLRGISAGGGVSVVTAELVSTPEMLHENQFDAFPQVEASPAGSEDFSTSSPDSMWEETVETAQPAPQEISHELPPQTDETQAHETTEVSEDFVAAARPVKSNGAGKGGRVPSDAYGIGVRLMRVSPVWLLLVGLGFISFIVFCNWLIKPAEQSGDVASAIAAANNQATNQSASRVIVPTSTAQSPSNRQADLPSNDTGVAFIATEATLAAEPKVETVEAKPAVEEKAATPGPSAKPPVEAAKPPVEAKAGKITIQIGSYNVAAEADGRVANLKSAGFDARSVKVDIPQRGTWYRVQSGRFGSRDEAERYGKQLRDKGIVTSFITTDVQE